MLANGQALISLITDSSYETRFSSPINVFQNEKWRSAFGLLKANLFFILRERTDGTQEPMQLLIIEDCLIELGDDNVTGMPHSFWLKFKTTGRSILLAADSLRSLEKWISILTVTPIDYINVTKQSLQEQLTSRMNELQTNETEKSK
uniref:PH domain-containing protein n=1 Tax=Steinernema glaseri TaxID=37863 RepID=A0A1I7YQG4_9BILA